MIVDGLHRTAGGSSAGVSARRSGHGVTLAAFAVVLAAAFGAVSLTDADPDLWGHVLFGRATLEHGLERTDPYSFTAEGRRWINHEWATEVLMAAIWQKGADRGLLFAKIASGVVTVLLLAAVARLRGRRPLLEALVLPVAVWAMSPGFLHRPQVLSFLMFAVVLWILHADDVGRRRVLWGLPLVMAVWPNLHGGFLIGGAAIAVAVIVRSLETVVRGDGRGPLVRLWIAAGLAAVATLCTPYGWQLHRFLLGSLSVPRPIGEWAPLNLFDGSHPAVTILAGACLMVVVVRRRYLRWWEVAIVVVMLVAALQHQRHAPFFAMAAAPFLIDGLGQLIGDRVTAGVLAPRRSVVRRLVITALVLVALSWGAVAGVRLSATAAHIGVDPAEFPVDAVRFIEQAELTGRLVLPFEWGEYAIWHLWPGCRVSVDGRFRTVYPEDVLEWHYAAHVDPGLWPGLASRLRGDLLLAPRDRAVERNLDREWVVAYADRTAIVVVRRNGVNDGVLAAIAAGDVDRPAPRVRPTFP